MVAFGDSMGRMATLLAAAAGIGTAYRLYDLKRKRMERLRLLAGSGEAQRYRGKSIVIVIDIGSSSVRASAFVCIKDEKAVYSSAKTKKCTNYEWILLADSMVQHPLDCIDADGCADIKILQIAAENVLSEELVFLRERDLSSSVVGVGFSTFVMNLLGVDEEGAPVTPVYTYAGRRPATASCAKKLRQELISRGAEREVHDRTGAVIHPAYAAAEFLRLHEEDPERLARVVRWQSISGYLIRKWTSGEALPMSYSEASWTGLLDFRNQRWDSELLSLVHMDEAKMPVVEESSTPFVGLSRACAKRWPELQRVPFFLGIGDGAAANIGSKCLDSEKVAVTVGTSAAMRVMLPSIRMAKEKVPAGLWCYLVDKDRVLLGGALNDGGSVYQWMRNAFPLSSKDVDAQVEKMKPMQHGLTMLPFLSGERAPGWAESATCTISGITKWTSSLDLLRAAMESVALRLSLLFSLLGGHTEPNVVLVASGTALTSSSAWRQMVADCVGRELLLEESAVEATSRGIAMAVGVALGIHTYSEVGQWSSEMLRSEPHVEAHRVYLEGRHAQESLYRQLYS